jgi:hypothetical protein
MLVERKEAADNTTALAGAVVYSSSFKWFASNIEIAAAAEITPGTVVARGLYL